MTAPRANPDPSSRTRSSAGPATRWGPLPGTKAELEALEQSYRKAVPGGALKVLRGAAADEAAVRSAAPGQAFLHLATHG